jgi:dihydroorotate dehydrogenase
VKKNKPDCILGVSIGKSKVVVIEDAIDDYLKSFDAVYQVADYVAVNVSSPNTPRLRELQQAEQLDELLRALQMRNLELSKLQEGHGVVPLLVKLSPDLELDELRNIVAVAQANNVVGLIATNTTTARAALKTGADAVRACGAGGLSGAPLRRRSLETIATLYNLTEGSLPLIGVGGIFTAEDAWEMICAGASLLQIYTGFIYEGPAIARKINEGLRRLVSGAGFVSLDEAVGSRAREFGTV